MESSPCAAAAGERRTAPLLAYAQLLRLPNVFTAVADILTGYWITHSEFDSRAEPILLVGASCGCYLAGMVLNDVWDLELDRRERPARPIPSGRISVTAAARLGWGLLISGIACGGLAATVSGVARVGAVVVLLALAVVLYDRWLKRTPMGPVAMGACRMLNMLLGMSLLDGPWQPMHWTIASGMGIYIVGVTWFARTEAERSERAPLAAATLVIMAGLFLLYRLPTLADGVPARLQPVYAELEAERWRWLWAIVALWVGARCIGAILVPHALAVQNSVKRCLQALIVINAVVCSGFWSDGAVLIFLLLLPMLLLGRWVYST